LGGRRDLAGEWSGLGTRAYSLERLDVDAMDIYRPARLDPAVPVEAIGDMVKGRLCVRYIRLSEVGTETIRRAAAVHPICDLPIAYSLTSSRGIEEKNLPTLGERGIELTARRMLSCGLISGHWNPPSLAPAISGASSRVFRATICNRILRSWRRFAILPNQSSRSLRLRVSMRLRINK
jgi:aryl-alcohol dehydrogenase-like predicted oxidoreductase